MLVLPACSHCRVDTRLGTRKSRETPVGLQKRRAADYAKEAPAAAQVASHAHTLKNSQVAVEERGGAVGAGVRHVGLHLSQSRDDQAYGAKLARQAFARPRSGVDAGGVGAEIKDFSLGTSGDMAADISGGTMFCACACMVVAAHSAVL